MVFHMRGYLGSGQLATTAKLLTSIPSRYSQLRYLLCNELAFIQFLSTTTNITNKRCRMKRTKSKKPTKEIRGY